MKTPICDFVRGYAESGISRLHMPGHKGVSFIGAERYDITEIHGADVLYSADGIIAESESNASSLFGTRHSFYSAEGSTLAIKAMLACALLPYSGRRKCVLAVRNVHKAFIYACAMLDLNVEWLMPQSFSEHFVSCRITPEYVEKRILECALKQMPDALYVTSPDYAGRVADISGIAEVCDKYGIPLLVDNAHGAYLAFLEENAHPISLGASFACDSAHKTLPVLTGGAYLHVSKKVNITEERVREHLSMFASTSPSYLILQSLDMCNDYLDTRFRGELAECVTKVDRLKQYARSAGVSLVEGEPLKLVVNGEKTCLKPQRLNEILRECGIESEFCDGYVAVLMFTPQNTDDDFVRVEHFIECIAKEKGTHVTKETEPSETFGTQRAMTIRQAMLCESETVSVDDAIGRIAAGADVSCPPAIPIAVCGEIIDRNTVELLKKYGVKEIKAVIKNYSA